MTEFASPQEPARPRVVIVGGGFAGLAAAKKLKFADADITIIDRHNHHLFQPLLYQVATAGLSPADIAYPIRAILRSHRRTRVLMAEAKAIDTAHKRVLTDDGEIPFDILVLATGARHSYFGHDDWEAFAPGLKTIDDATRIRRHILMAFERAETSTSDSERQALLTFVIVGAGPTGVEMAGAIVELARKALRWDFRRIDPRQTRVILMEAGKRVLPAYPDALSAKAKRELEKLGVEVRLETAVTSCDAGSVEAGGEKIDAGTIIWAAGVAASPAAEWLGAAKTRAGQVSVLPDLTVPGHPDIYAAGDTASVAGPGGKPLPGTSQVAAQQGAYIGDAIAARLSGGRDIGPFRYRHRGDMATIGRKSAVVDFGWIRMSGFMAWLLWSLAHIYFLIDFRTRMIVMMEWAWAYFTFKRGARLITGGDDAGRR